MISRGKMILWKSKMTPFPPRNIYVLGVHITVLIGLPLHFPPSTSPSFHNQHIQSNRHCTAQNILQKNNANLFLPLQKLIILHCQDHLYKSIRSVAFWTVSSQPAIESTAYKITTTNTTKPSASCVWHPSSVVHAERSAKRKRNKQV